MTAAALKQGTDTELRTLLEKAIDSIGETLSSLVGRDIRVDRGAVTVQDPSDLLESLPRACSVARGAMDKGYSGHSMLTLLEVPDAVAMSGLLMMTPEDVIAQRRKANTLDGEDIEAFGELGNVLYSGFSNVLRERVTDFDVRMQGQAHVEPGKDEEGVLGDARLVTISFKMKVGEYPESKGLVAIDLETAERWNGAPIEPVGAAPEVAAGRPEDETFDDIPAAPIRGSLAAYVIQSDVLRVLRLSCRRVGLELTRHGRGEIPNPAAHRNEIVVLDVPPGEDRRFDWCRRIKDLSETTRVMLLLHHPSRQRVTQAFLSRADAILGFPCEEPQLSQKLEQLTPEPTTEPEGPDDGDAES
ncbi:MAG: hypothetical protein ACE37K_18260 [Planctomycetota bacterium]